MTYKIWYNGLKDAFLSAWKDAKKVIRKGLENFWQKTKSAYHRMMAFLGKHKYKIVFGVGVLAIVGGVAVAIVIPMCAPAIAAGIGASGGLGAMITTLSGAALTTASLSAIGGSIVGGVALIAGIGVIAGLSIAALGTFISTFKKEYAG